VTRRERMEARADRRLDWAESRERKAAAGFNRADAISQRFAGGQPILIGHHSERRARRDQERMHGAMSAGCESQRMAEHHRGKAAGIDRQLARSIFSDDPDAPERLAERIAKLEARRDTFKRANAAFKRGGIAAVLAECGEQIAKKGAQTLAACHWESRPFPPFELTNLGANIRRLRERLEGIEARRPAGDAPAPQPGEGV